MSSVYRKASPQIYGSPEKSGKAPNRARQPCSVLFTCTASPLAPMNGELVQPETSVRLAPNRTFSNWTDRASTDPTLGTWKKAIHMKGEKKNLKDWLLRQETSLVQASSQLLWKETAAGGTEGTVCSHLGRGKIHPPFSLDFRGRKDMPLSLSRQVYCYITNISTRCTPTQTKLNSEHNGWVSNVFTHQRQSPMRCFHWHRIFNVVYGK